MPNFKNAQEHTAHLQKMAQAMSAALPGLGFCLLVFEFGKEGRADYISNANREQMIQAMRENADALEKGRDYKVPQSN